MLDRMKGLTWRLVAIAGALSIGGCDTLKDSSKEDLLASGGAGACGAAGALLGGQLPTWARGLVVVGGAAGCGFVGKQIGAYLDDQDRQKMNTAAQETLRTGKVQKWQSPDGKTKGSTKLVKNPTGTAKGCQTVAQTLTLADGTKKSEDVTICGNDGRNSVQDPVVNAGDTGQAAPSSESYTDWLKRKATEASNAVGDAL